MFAHEEVHCDARGLGLLLEGLLEHGAVPRVVDVHVCAV